MCKRFLWHVWCVCREFRSLVMVQFKQLSLPLNLPVFNLLAARRGQPSQRPSDDDVNDDCLFSACLAYQMHELCYCKRSALGIDASWMFASHVRAKYYAIMHVRTDKPSASVILWMCAFLFVIRTTCASSILMRNHEHHNHHHSKQRVDDALLY